MATGSGSGTPVTPSSTAISYTAAELVKDALRLCGVLASGETPTAAMYQDGLDAMNMIMQEWTAQGIGFWQHQQVTLTLVADQTSYTLGPGSGETTVPATISRPLEIVESRLYLNDSGTEIPMEALSRQEYMELSLKSSSGKPTQFWYDKQNPNGELYIWPTADSASDTIKFTIRVPVDELDDTSDTPDFPQEWYHAIKYNLASAIALEYNVPDNRHARIEAKAAQALKIVMDNDRLNTSVHFQIDRLGRGR